VTPNGQRWKVLQLRLRRSWRLALAIALGSTAAASLAARLDRLDLLGLKSAEHSMYDRGLRTFTRSPQRSPAVSIIAVDDRTFQMVAANPDMKQAYGGWPYYRQVWLHLAEHLVDEGARAVVLDFTLDEESSDITGDVLLGDGVARRQLPLYVGLAASPAATVYPRVEARNVFQAAPLPVTPPADAVAGPEEFSDAPQAQALSAEEAARALAFPVKVQPPLALRELDRLPDQHQVLRISRPVAPIQPLLRVVPGAGLVKPEADPDGKMRRTHFAYTDGANAYVTLSVAVAADLLGAEALELSPGRLTLGARALAINEDGSAEIDYGGPQDARFDHHSLFDVLNDRALKAAGQPRYLPPGLFRDRVVLVGGFAAGLSDLKATPFSAAEPGVVKHAAELDSLLRGRFIVRASGAASVALALLTAAVSVLLVLLARSIVLEIAWPLVLYGGFFAVGGLILVAARVHVDAAPAMAAGILASLSATAANHLFASRERERMKQMFGHYLSRHVVQQLAEQPDLPKLTGEDLEITAFFSDIRGFSTFSEKYKDDPRSLVQILNTYLTRVSAALLEHGACLDKYIGDAVVCIFGAPVRHQDHAVRACRGALAARAEVDRLREEFRARGLPDVYTRIGVNTAVMFVGNVGSEQLFNYTAIGDGMNLAARLEGANKSYDTSIMIGPRTYELARDFIEARELDRVRVAGKSEAVAVYELLCLKGELPESKRRVVQLYEEALAQFRQARFDECLASLDRALALDPADGPSRALGARCRKAQALPPGSPFDAVANLEK
jgi:adenylate cyclase